MKKILLVTLYLTFIFLLLEGLCHLLPDHLFLRQAGYRTMKSDDLIPFTLKKNSRSVWATRDFRMLVETNSFGMRDQEYELKKPANTLRILALGDSFTWGWGVEKEEIYVEQLEKMLNQPHLLKKFGVSKVEVLNAGSTGGYSTDTYYLYLKHRGIQYQPDIVLVGFLHHSDVNDTVYTSNWVKTKNGLPEKIEVVGDRHMAAKIERGKIRTIESFFVRHSRFLTKLRDIFAWLRYRTFSRKKQAADTAFDESFDFLGFYRKEMPPIIEEGWKRVQATTLGMQSICKEHNARLLFAILPTDLQIYPERAVKIWTQSMAGGEKKDVNISVLKADFPQKRTKEFLIKHHIPFIDLLPAFRKSSFQYKFEEMFYPGDAHWTPLGHRIAAHTIEEWFNQNAQKLLHERK